ncbi:MAG: G1 family glutamic endopeptidase [Candidatus Dormiibacterota bacterium]
MAVTATSSCPSGTSPLYSYFTSPGTLQDWTLRAAWIGPTWSWSTVGLALGTYQVLVWVSDGPYTVPQAQEAATITIAMPAACTEATASVNPSSPSPGQTVAVTATSSCPSGSSPLYSYFTSPGTLQHWTLRAAWIGPSWGWSTAGLALGDYQVLVWVSDGPYTVPQAQGAATITIANPAACTGVVAAANPSSASPGSTVMVTATPSCPSDSSPLYSYFTSPGTLQDWTLRAAWIGDSWNWSTAGLALGTYQVLIWVSDGPYTVPQAEGSANITVANPAACTGVVATASPNSLSPGSTVMVTATPSCPSGSSPLYSYFTSPDTLQDWTLRAAWIGPNWNWSTAGLAVGTYQVLIWVSDGPYTVPQAQGAATITITGPLAITTAAVPNATVGSGYSTTLAAEGGTPPYTWSITSGSLPAGLSLSSSGVVSGTPTAAGTSTVNLQVRDSTLPTAESATASLSIVVNFAPASQLASSNWSGYSIASGPYSYVSGTFNVPGLYAASTDTYVSEWTGIDGASDSDLIQAGVTEMFDPDTDLVYLLPWWEILPAAETPITTMSVLPGDAITVTIGQVSGTAWKIVLTNDTTAQSFTTDQTYTGPGTSVEWIVEAPDVDGSIATLGDYSTNVTFSGLSVTGSQNSLSYWYMVQGGVQVSTPSTSLTESGFDVAYGDLAPPPP